MPELSSGGGPVCRPGAMTMVMNATRPRVVGPRWLRWALVRDGRIVVEEVRSPDRPLTIGGDGDIAVQGRERELLVHRDGSWFLKVFDGLEGRTDDGPIAELARGVDEIELSPSAHARIELGGVSLLIQLVDRPPVRRRSQLPASLQGGLLKGADWWFTSFVTGSFLIHLGVVTFLMQADWPVEISLIPDRYTTQIFMPQDPPPNADVMDADPDEPLADYGEVADDGEADWTEPERELPDVQPSGPSDAPPSPTLDRAALAYEIAENLLIAGFGPSSTDSAMNDVLRGGAPTGEARRIFDVVDGIGVATSMESGHIPVHDGRGHSGGSTRDLGALATRPGRGTSPVDEGLEIEEVIVTVTPAGPLDWDPPAGGRPFDHRQLVNRLRPRMGAIRRCYENEINHGNPDAAGRLTLVMTVTPIGSLANVHVEDDTIGSERLAACAIRAIRGVRVAPGPTEPVDVRYPIVFSSPNSR